MLTRSLVSVQLAAVPTARHDGGGDDEENDEEQNDGGENDPAAIDGSKEAALEPFPAYVEPTLATLAEVEQMVAMVERPSFRGRAAAVMATDLIRGRVPYHLPAFVAQLAASPPPPATATVTGRSGRAGLHRPVPPPLAIPTPELASEQSSSSGTPSLSSSSSPFSPPLSPTSPSPVSPRTPPLASLLAPTGPTKPTRLTIPPTPDTKDKASPAPRGIVKIKVTKQKDMEPPALRRIIKIMVT